MANKDLFYLDKVFPEPEKIFSETFKSVSEIIKDGIVVLDTNILLVLFDVNEKNITDIKAIYDKYKKAGRLFIPTRVAREFANNRATKIGDIFLQIRQLKDRLNIGHFKINPYPILEHSDDYKGLQKDFDTIKKTIKSSHKHLENLESQIQSWTWDDNISLAYKEIFTADIIIDVKRPKDEIEKDLSFRIEYKVAPGYKDSNKADDGIGDLIIWQTLLEIGKDKQKDVIFVTNDQKNDWFYKQDKIGLYPKYELFDEFRRNTGGKSIAIIDFVKFLNLSNAKQDTITDIKNTIEANANYTRGVSDLSEGMFIEHITLGKGKVERINGGIIDVLFDQHGKKQLFHQYAPLRILRECTHPNVIRVMNGIYEEYLCTSCKQIIQRHLSDDID